MDFTFQYVSINTDAVKGFRAVFLSFTFQYVSINTTAHQREVLDLQTLHSNMFLLIQF